MKNKNQFTTRWKSWPYKNTTLLILSVIVFVLLARIPAVDTFIRQIGSLGYIGAFVAGVFFVSTFTAVPAAYVLYTLAEHLHPIEIALIAGVGAMIGDYIVFKIFKDRIFDELKPALQKIKYPLLSALFKTPYFSWLLPVTGAIVIASPLPDEAGVGLLGLSKIRKWQFFVITFTLNAIGIFLIVSFSRL